MLHDRNGMFKNSGNKGQFVENSNGSPVSKIKWGYNKIEAERAPHNSSSPGSLTDISKDVNSCTEKSGKPFGSTRNRSKSSSKSRFKNGSARKGCKHKRGEKLDIYSAGTSGSKRRYKVEVVAVFPLKQFNSFISKEPSKFWKRSSDKAKKPEEKLPEGDYAQLKRDGIVSKSNNSVYKDEIEEGCKNRETVESEPCFKSNKLVSFSDSQPSKCDDNPSKPPTKKTGFITKSPLTSIIENRIANGTFFYNWSLKHTDFMSKKPRCHNEDIEPRNRSVFTTGGFGKRVSSTGKSDESVRSNKVKSTRSNESGVKQDASKQNPSNCKGDLETANSLCSKQVRSDTNDLKKGETVKLTSGESPTHRKRDNNSQNIKLEKTDINENNGKPPANDVEQEITDINEDQEDEKQESDNGDNERRSIKFLKRKFGNFRKEKEKMALKLKNQEVLDKDEDKENKLPEVTIEEGKDRTVVANSLDRHCRTPRVDYKKEDSEKIVRLKEIASNINSVKKIDKRLIIDKNRSSNETMEGSKQTLISINDLRIHSDNEGKSWTAHCAFSGNKKIFVKQRTPSKSSGKTCEKPLRKLTWTKGRKISPRILSKCSQNSNQDSYVADSTIDASMAISISMNPSTGSKCKNEDVAKRSRR